MTSADRTLVTRLGATLIVLAETGDRFVLDEGTLAAARKLDERMRKAMAEMTRRDALRDRMAAE